MPEVVATSETLALRELLEARRDDIDVFPIQLLKRPISDSALADAVSL